MNAEPNPFPPLDWWTDEIADAWAYHQERFAALYEGRPVDGVVAVRGRMAGRNHGLWGVNDIDMLRRPEEWLNDALADMAAHAQDAADRRTFRPFVFDLDAYGTHYIDAIFGVAVAFRDGQVWSEPLQSDMAELAMPDLAASETFQASLRLARRATQAAQGRLFIATPVLSCPINIAINLYGGAFLEALIERPDAAAHALRVITEVIAASMAAFREVIPPALRLNSVGADRYAPPGHGFLDGCATHLVSAGHYRRVFAPLDAELLGSFPRPGMIHLCGAHEQHIPAWREMPQLRSVQLNDRAVEGLEAYVSGLRDDQVIYAMPCPTMPTERILELCPTHRLVLEGDLP